MLKYLVVKKSSLPRLSWLLVLFLILGSGGAFLPMVLAQEPPPRPSPPPQPPNPPPNRPTPPPQPTPLPLLPGQYHSTVQEAVTLPCSTLHGLAVNWGFRNEPKIPVHLTGTDWQSEKITDDNGYYAFECLGKGIGLVNLTAPPGPHPLTTDVALRLGYWPDFEINLGLYGGEITPAAEVTPTLTVNPHLVAPGQSLTYTMGVVNTAGVTMTGVMITDLLPETLKPVEATTTVGYTELWDNLLTAAVGELAPGQAVTITLAAMVRSETITGATITNRASLIYSGHVVRQTTPVTLEMGASALPVNEAAGTEFNLPAVLPETGGEKADNLSLEY